MAHETNTPIDISVVIEGENVLLSEDERCFRMLRQLRKQLAESRRTAEALILFNPGQVSRASIEAALRKYVDLEDSGAAARLRLEEALDSRYYELKNEGARRARGQIVVFLDSDVVPEDVWLEEISWPFFEHPEIDVVAGHTYLSCESLVEKAFALGWFFPLRDSSSALHSDRQAFLPTTWRSAARYC